MHGREIAMDRLNKRIVRSREMEKLSRRRAGSSRQSSKLLDAMVLERCARAQTSLETSVALSTGQEHQFTTLSDAFTLR